MQTDFSVNPINYFYIAEKINYQDSSDKSFSRVMANIQESNLQLSTLIVPNFNNVKELSNELSDKISRKLRESDIKTSPPVNINVNARTLEIEVTGERTDLNRIKEILNSDKDIKEKLFRLNAFTEFLAALPEHLAFQKEYRASNNPGAVVNKFAHLFSSVPVEHEIKFMFTGEKIDIYYDGESWKLLNEIM